MSNTQDWTVEQDIKGAFHVVCPATGFAIAEVGASREHAELLAAAPDLLRALELTADCLQKALTGGEVSAKLAGRALVQAAEAVTRANRL